MGDYDNAICNMCHNTKYWLDNHDKPYSGLTLNWRDAKNTKNVDRQKKKEKKGKWENNGRPNEWNIGNLATRGGGKQQFWKLAGRGTWWRPPEGSFT